jgi:hypothetical protein
LLIYYFRDGRESFVVTKVFDVEQLESDIIVHNGDDLEFMSEIPAVQVIMAAISSQTGVSSMVLLSCCVLKDSMNKCTIFEFSTELQVYLYDL